MPEPHDVPREVLAALTRLASGWSSTAVQQRIAHGVDVDLDPTALRAVYVLGLRGGPSRPSELADDLHITRPTASKLLARLLDDDLVRRSPDADDGRAGVIELSPRGREAYERLASAGCGLVAETLSGWTPAEVDGFSTLLGRFVDGLLAPPHPS